ncbi:hypothetical protein [Coleofasciculus sp. H7-2]
MPAGVQSLQDRYNASKSAYDRAFSPVEGEIYALGNRALTIEFPQLVRD